MTKSLEEAIDKIRELPEDRQAYVAAMLEIIAAQDQGLYRLTDKERTEVQAGLAQIERGEIASDEEVAGMWKRFGLRGCATPRTLAHSWMQPTTT